MYCNGTLCASCGKCRDWYYTGDVSSWEWIRNVKNWGDHDRKLWNDGKYWEYFKRRNGATCRYVYDYDCLCEDNFG
ncbi:unnamed protein product, partial [Rotaria socialis]